MTDPRSLGRAVAVTLGGVLIGLVVGYIPSLLVWVLVGVLTQGTSQTGGWAEAGSIGGVVWLASAGLIVGLLQQRAIPPSGRNVLWILSLSAVWAAAHIVEMVRRGQAGDVDLASILPALVVVSLVIGVTSHGLASRS